MNFNDPAILPEPIPSATAIHEAGHAVVGALLGAPPLLVSIEEGEFEYGRADFPSLRLGDLWPEDAADVALIRRHLVIGWAGHCATRSIRGAADEVSLGVVPSVLAPTGRLATNEGDFGRLLRIADFATHSDPLLTGVLVDETEVLADLLVADPKVPAAIWNVSEALYELTVLDTDEVLRIVADLLRDPPDLAIELNDPEEVCHGITEVAQAGFLELPEAAAAELRRRSVDRISGRHDDAFAPEPEDGETLSDIARAVAALVNQWIGDYPEEVA